MKFSTYIYSIIQLAILFLSIVTNWYDTLVYAITIVSMFMMLEKVGKGIALREVMGFYNCFVCLFMPMMGYIFFTKNDPIAASFVRFMPVSKEVYYDYCLPAVTAFVTVLNWPLPSSKHHDYGIYVDKLIQSSRKQLTGHQKLGVTLLGIGVLFSLVIIYIPVSFQYIFSLIYFSSFAGLLYIFFTPAFPFRKLIMILFGSFIVIGSLRNGMFTIIVYMGMTMFSFFFIGSKIAFWKKLSFLLIAGFCLVILQTVKPEYRVKVLRKNTDNSIRGSEFLDIALDRVSNLENAMTTKYLFPVYYRTNQGFYVGLVMKRFPAVKPFDDGSNIAQVILSSFVPRFLWPDKPMAGGIANMKYYAGLTIKGYTTNVGPLGEAYASFGVTGGIIYMAFLGAFIRFAYSRVFFMARKMPLLIFWIPVIFYQVTYSAENDTLQIMNSLVKSSVFVFILYKMIPQLFMTKQFYTKRPANVQLNVNPV